MKNYTLGKHISKINTEEISQMVKEISQEKVKKIHFCNHFSLSTKFTNKKLHSRKACIKTNLEEEISQDTKILRSSNLKFVVVVDNVWSDRLNHRRFRSTIAKQV